MKIRKLFGSNIPDKSPLDFNKYSSIEKKRRIQISSDYQPRKISTLQDNVKNIQCPTCRDFGVITKNDVYPFQVSMPNSTCQDIEYMFSLPEYKAECLNYTEIYFDRCCDFSHQKLPVYSCVNNIQNKLFTDSNNLLSPPYITVGKPIDLNVLLSYQSVEEINVKTNSASIYIYLTLSWNDPRLAWNITEDLCSPAMTVRASINAEQSQIWVPEFDLLNRKRGVQEWPEVNAKVSFDGTVTWQRTGLLTSVCSFRGLMQMPFDTLGCQFIFGRYSEEHLFQIAHPEIEILTVGQTYKEFEFASKLVSFTMSQLRSYHSTCDYLMRNRIPFFPSCPFLLKTRVSYHPPRIVEGFELAEKSILVYDFYFQRSYDFYVFKMLVPSILFTYISFGLFFLDVRLGERLGFGLSILLVSVAQDIITNEYIPISQERLWLVLFIQCSTYWIFLAIFETIFCAWVYYKAGRSDDEQESASVTKQPSTFGESPLPTAISNDPIASSFFIRNSTRTLGTVKTKEIAKGTLVPSDTSMNPIHEFDSDPEVTQKNVETSSLDLTKEHRYFHGRSKRLFSRMLGFEHVSEVERLLFINRMDRFFLRFCMFGYTLFIIIMFAVRGTFLEKNEGNAWVIGPSVDEF